MIYGSAKPLDPASRSCISLTWMKNDKYIQAIFINRFKRYLNLVTTYLIFFYLIFLITYMLNAWSQCNPTLVYFSLRSDICVDLQQYSPIMLCFLEIVVHHFKDVNVVQALLPSCPAISINNFESLWFCRIFENASSSF